MEVMDEVRQNMAGLVNARPSEVAITTNTTQGIGMPEIEAQILKLSSKLWKGLDDLGFEMFTPPNTASGIVTRVVEDADRAERLLEENRIAASLKAGGHLRFSPHFFNTEEEVEHLLCVMEIGG